MVEVIGVIASVSGIAAEGIKLSNALYSYAHKVKHAEEDMKSISKDIKNTAVVLNQLEEILEQNSRGKSLDPEKYSLFRGLSNWLKQTLSLYPRVL